MAGRGGIGGVAVLRMQALNGVQFCGTVLPAYSRHQNHWYWGPPPQEYTSLILLQYNLESVQKRCTSFEAFAHHDRWGMGEENTPIYLCRGTKVDLRKTWRNYHHWN
jgi:hypothetical protein